MDFNRVQFILKTSTFGCKLNIGHQQYGAYSTYDIDKYSLDRFGKQIIKNLMIIAVKKFVGKNNKIRMLYQLKRMGSYLDCSYKKYMKQYLTLK